MNPFANDNAILPERRKPTEDEARTLLSAPSALTRTVRVPQQLRRPRIG